MRHLIFILILICYWSGYAQYQSTDSKIEKGTKIWWKKHFRVKLGEVYNPIKYPSDISRLTPSSSPEILNIGVLTYKSSTMKYTGMDLGRIKIIPEMQLDHFRYSIEDFENQTSSQSLILSGLNVLYKKKNGFNFFVKSVLGVKSNINQEIGISSKEKEMNTMYALDIGIDWQLSSRLSLNATVWYLNFNQEFEYIEDEEVATFSGKKKNAGLDFTSRYQINAWLYIDADIGYAFGGEELLGEDDTAQFNDEFVAEGGIGIDNYKNFSGKIMYRYFQDGITTKYTTSQNYLVADAEINYNWKNFNFGIVMENIFDGRYNDSRVAGASRLTNKLDGGTEEVYFTPENPFTIEARITYSF